MQSYLVLMFDGSVKMVANVQKGDTLMGPDSKPRIVTSVQVCEGVAFEIKPLKGKSFGLGGDN
jgi:hypothetical protein